MHHILPVYFHIPKNGGSYTSLMFFRALFRDNDNTKFVVITRGNIPVYNIICQNIDNEKIFTRYDHSPWEYYLDIEDIHKLKLDKINLRYISISSNALRHYQNDILHLIPGNFVIQKIICFRSPFERLQSLYSYRFMHVNQSIYEVNKHLEYLPFDDYVQSDLLEEGWLIRNLLNIRDDQPITVKHYNDTCNMLDEFHIIDFNSLNQSIDECVEKYCNVKPFPHDHPRFNTPESRNETKQKIDIVFDELTSAAKNNFNERQNWDIKIYNRYIKTPKISIITVTYDNDLEYLKYNLKSIRMFCQNYHENVVVIDDHENDCTKTCEYLDSINQKYFINKEAKYVKRGYVRQQYMKLLSDKYVSEDTDYILHIDSDSIFTRKHSPSEWFIHDKPAMQRTSYKMIQHRNPVAFERSIIKWKNITSKMLGTDVNYEYMRGMPLIYPKHVHQKCREFIESQFDKSLLECLKDMVTISEYNILGAYSNIFHKEDFYWLTEDEADMRDKYFEYNRKRANIVGRYSSREFQQPKLYVDLNNPDNPIAKVFQ